MSQSAVQQILERIEQLPAEDRLELEERLAELAEVQWRHETEEARRAALAMGLSQAKIDQVIEELRHPA